MRNLIASLMILAFAFSAEAGFFNFGKKKPKPGVQEITVSLVKVQKGKYEWIEEYVDQEGNVRLKQDFAIFGNYQAYEYVSSSQAVFPRQVWLCQAVDSRGIDCEKTILAELNVYSESMTEACPLDVVFEINKIEAKIKEIKPKDCHVK